MHSKLPFNFSSSSHCEILSLFKSSHLLIETQLSPYFRSPYFRAHSHEMSHFHSEHIWLIDDCWGFVGKIFSQYIGWDLYLSSISTELASRAALTALIIVHKAWEQVLCVFAFRAGLFCCDEFELESHRSHASGFVNKPRPSLSICLSPSTCEIFSCSVK